jgi:drug/metabolite transporter (DMT)-like permease
MDKLTLSVGLVLMFGWGIADFISSKVVRKLGSFKTIYLNNIIWTIALIPFAFFFDMSINPINFIPIFGATICQVIAMYYFYQSMKIGEISVVTPISASYSLVTVFLLMILFGYELSLLSLVAIFILVLGIILTSTDLKKIKHLHTVKGVKESIVALLGWGVFYVFFEIAAKDITFFVRFPPTSATALFFHAGIIMGISQILFSTFNKGVVHKKDLKNNNSLFLMVIANIIYLITWSTLNLGIVTGNTALIAAISSLYPAITVILAMVFFKEKLVLNQWFGIFTIFAGLALIGFSMSL